MERGQAERGQAERGQMERGPRPMADRGGANRGGEDRSGVEASGGERGQGETTYPYLRQQRNPARIEAQETPRQPADERMAAAAKECADLYRAWKENPAESGAQQLGDALHELRKVVARMEIEMSVSRREEQRPIPVYNYRVNQPPPQQPRS